jgi:hypothetical protein
MRQQRTWTFFPEQEYDQLKEIAKYKEKIKGRSYGLSAYIREATEKQMQEDLKDKKIAKIIQNIQKAQ